jgi:hypothetical protein
MSNKTKREARLLRASPVRTSSSVPYAAPSSHEYLVLNGDGTISVDPTKLEPPQNIYSAEHAWVEASEGSVNLIFAQGADPENRLLSRLKIAYTLEHFYLQLWVPSREFHQKLKDNVAKLPTLAVEDSKQDVKMWKADQHATLCVNYSFFVQAGSDAVLDFYNLTPNAMFLFGRTQDLRKLAFEPKARVQISSHELLRLLDSCSALADEMKPKVELFQQSQEPFRVPT